MYATHFSLELTKRCNLRCDYCYWEDHPELDCTFDYAKKVLDWVTTPAVSGDAKQVNISLFGGEPLLKYDLIHEIKAYAKTLTKQIKFGITSNGTLLTPERIDWLVDNKVSVSPFSIDGARLSHDMHRKNLVGQGSFDMLVKNLPYLLKRQGRTTGRMTITPTTIPYLAENVRFLVEELGFASVAAALVTDVPGATIPPWDEGALAIIEEQYRLVEKWVGDRIVKRVPNPIAVSFLWKNARNILKNTDLKSPCGAGRGYLGIANDGVYPCHRFTCWPEWRLGVVGGKLDEEKRDKFSKFNRENNNLCRGCPNRFCGGNCYAANYAVTGDPFKVDPIVCSMVALLQQSAERLVAAHRADPYFQQQFIEKKPSGGNATDIATLARRNQELVTRVARLEFRVATLEKRPVVNAGNDSVDARTHNKKPCPNCP